jgi:hypothetical protein
MVVLNHSDLAPPGPVSLFRPAVSNPRPPEPRLTLISSEEFATTEYKLEWLVEQVLVKGQPAVWGGPKKSLKTNTLVDFALALGTPGEHGRGRFLGRFEVPRPVRVALFSGESGEHTLQETARRIARSRGLDLAQAAVHWGFALPKVASPPDLEEVRKLIRDEGLEVLIVDPLYLSLLGGGADVDTKNLYSVGPVLREFAQACLQNGCTPVLAHHAKKGREREERWQPLDLDDLAFAGISEFARQWVLINRRTPYEEGTGRHELWLKVGGSVGFSGLWGVNIAEGEVDLMFAGRTWEVKVVKSEDVRRDQEERKEAAKTDRERRAKSHRDAELTGEALKVFRRKHPVRLSIADLCRHTTWRADRANRAVALLCVDGVLKDCGKVKASNGKKVDTYGLAQPPGEEGAGQAAKA